MKSFYDSGVFQKCRTSNTWNRQILQDDEAIHAGEADAITQAQEQDIPIFIGDEKDGRRIAEKMGKKSVGTAGILAKLHIQNLANDPRELVKKLRRRQKCRISDEIIEEAMKRAFEPIF